MREIKFRAIKRDLAHEQFPNKYEPTDQPMLYGTGVYDDGFNTWLILENPDKKCAASTKIAIVKSETVGQYTGLTDKNGKEIYEGDILKWNEKEWGSPFNEVVEWDYSQFNIRANDWKEWCEVIGNIYENTNLLEVTE